MRRDVAGHPLLLGIDVGSSRIKAVTADEEGRELQGSAVPTPFGERGGRVEMTVEDLGAALRRALEGLEGRDRVVGVGVAGIAESGAPLDCEGRPLAPVMAWHDPRGQEKVDLLQERFGDGLAHRVGQPLRTVSSVAKLGWLVDHGVEKPARWLGVPELTLHLLTGSHATEWSLAARTGCFDVAGRRWMPEVAEAAGFGVDVFPPVRAAGEVLGEVSASASRWSGLPTGAPVTVAGHDHSVAMVGSGAAPGGDGWVALASAARAGLVLEEVAGELGRSPAELDRLAEDADPVDAAGLVQAVAGGQECPLPPGEPGQVWGGVLRELSARTADAVRRLTELVGPAPRMVVVGGGRGSRAWMEAKAAAVPLPLARSAATEAAARGAALFGGVAAGWWASPAAAPSPPLEPLVARGPR